MTGRSDPPPSLRRAEAEDAPWMAELEARAGHGRWNARAFAGELRAQHSHTLIAIGDQQRPIGFILFWALGDEAELVNIAVEPAWQRRGVARRLFQAMLDELRGAGCRRVHLEVRESNRPAQALYREFGFAENRKRAAYYEDTGEDALCMLLQLADD